MPIYARAHQEVVHIWSEDPSLEQPQSAEARRKFEERHEEFKKTGDTTKLVYKPGETPVLFRVKSLTHAQKLRVGDVVSVAVARMQAVGQGSIAATMLLYPPCAETVAYGLVKVEGMIDNDGSPLELKRAGDRLTDETMEKLSYNGLIVELGLRIYEISSPDPTRGQA